MRRLASSECASADVPTRPEVGVLALVPDPWEQFWGPRHQILSRLARHFRVLWVEPPWEFRDAMVRRHPARQRLPESTPPPGLEVFRAEIGPPRLYRPVALASWAARLRLARAARRLRRRGCERIVLYLWRHAFAESLDLVAHDLSLYHIDDEYSFDERDDRLDPAEAALIARVDQVLIHSPALLAKKGHINPNTAHVPNGVDYRLYATARAEPSELAAIPRPRVGYAGFLKRQLDWELIAELAERHPEWSWVLVGPLSPHPEARAALERLLRLPQVRWLGGKPVGELPAYVQHFDVCLMPYRHNAYTRHIYPLKLHEYLAAGRPVVATRLPSLEAFSHVVRLVEERSDWERAISESLAAPARAESAVAARRAVAAEHDWNRLAARVAAIVADRLGLRARGEAPSAAEVGAP